MIIFDWIVFAGLLCFWTENSLDTGIYWRFILFCSLGVDDSNALIEFVSSQQSATANTTADPVQRWNRLILQTLRLKRVFKICSLIVLFSVGNKGLKSVANFGAVEYIGKNSRISQRYSLCVVNSILSHSCFYRLRCNMIKMWDCQSMIQRVL